MKKNYHHKRTNSKPRQRKSYAKSNPKPWNWLVVGLLLGIILSGLIWLKSSSHKSHPNTKLKQAEQSELISLDEIPKPKSKKTHTPTTTHAAQKHKPTLKSDPKAGKYDFYDMLSSGENVSVKPIEQPAIEEKQINHKKNYVLQIASYKTFSEADRLKAELIVMGYDVFISKIKQNDINWNRVNIGPYDSLSKVQQSQKELQKHDIDSVIVELD